MDVRILSGSPTVEEARAIERAFAQIEAEAKAAVRNEPKGRDAWTLSGRLAAHRAAGALSDVR